MSLLDWEQLQRKEETVTSICKLALFFSTLQDCVVLPWWWPPRVSSPMLIVDGCRFSLQTKTSPSLPCLPTNHQPSLCIVMMFCTLSSQLITAQLVILASKVQYSDNMNIVTHFTLRSDTILMVLQEANIYISCPEYWQQCPNIIEMSAAA